jgi:putative GTP pyrophosphokinase
MATSIPQIHNEAVVSSEEYASRLPAYQRLSINLEQALAGFLQGAGVPYLTISSRIKEFQSLSEKVSRKSYADPFSQCEDICGVRIICYYPSDLQRIEQIIQSEFVIHESLDKGASLGVQEFGYRSNHYIVSVKPAWLAAPNYRGLEALRVEVQVRTILMHAWAEIQHKLAYKSSEQIPDLFRRKFSRLSAKFEEADEQFEEIRQALATYRKRLEDAATTTGSFDRNSDLNLDSLTALLSFYFPDRGEVSLEPTRSLLEQFQELGLTMADLVDACERALPFLPEYEALVMRGTMNRWVAVGAMRAALDITNEAFFKARFGGAEKVRAELLNKIRKRLPSAEHNAR